MHILVDPSARPVIAHRGNRAHAPENTLLAIRQALALGIDGVEFDVRTTRDGVLVLMHDPTVDRTTNGAGRVDAMSLAEVRQLDAGAQFTTDAGRTFPFRGQGLTVPTFDEAVETIRALPMIVEIKSPDATEAVRRAVHRHGIADRVLVAGFDSRAVHPLRGESFPLGGTTGDALRLLPRALLHRAAGQPSYRAMCLPPTWHGIRVPMAAMARTLRRSGRVLHVWTINDASDARRFWADGINGIISDDPATILKARAT